MKIFEDTIKLRDTYYDKTEFGTEREYKHLPSIYTHKTRSTITKLFKMDQMLPNDLISWIRQKLSKHQSYLKVKLAKRSVKLNAEEMYFLRLKIGFYR